MMMRMLLLDYAWVLVWLLVKVLLRVRVLMEIVVPLLRGKWRGLLMLVREEMRERRWLVPAAMDGVTLGRIYEATTLRRHLWRYM
uniref:Putative secreted protein n=1 Tax=Ixodes ricinus TaxID=34613 RepID=A0A6B0UEV3_IXORI